MPPDDGDDAFGLVVAAPFLLPLMAPAVLSLWDGARVALMERHLIAPPGDVIVEVPGWDGAGLGGVHIVVVVCALVTTLVIATSVAAQQRRRTIDIEGWGTS